ncbi:MAG: GH3 auxin-responsive promoter family protein [Bacteroidetes bacterium]|nr:GH3 auxin-responsive promoter family protein [Bacteroidota bacterium]
MKFKSFLARPYANIIHSRIRKGMMTALSDQAAILQHLLKLGLRTDFGQEHKFRELNDYPAFSQAVPLRDYEALSSYINKIKEGREHVLWRGKPLYFAKTSGTTSGVKYIPITKDSIGNHIDTARNALLCYMAESGKPAFADGKMIFLSGSPTLERVGGIPTGRLSGIVNHFIPRYLRANQLPSFETNCIEDWESKLAKIVTETFGQDLRLISGIPPWIQMYFDWLQERSGGKKIKQIFPNLQVLVHGGVAFEPYKAKLLDSLGGQIDTLETFPASEGFFAFQDTLDQEGLLLNTDSGIYFEFVPAAEIFNPHPTRLSLADVKLNENYALIINSNAGLWGYNIGDTVRFVSLNPFRILVTGRTKHFISAFGEHVIGEEVEAALLAATEKTGARIIEFTVAPMVQVASGLPYHEWYIAFENPPASLPEFARLADEALREKNIYYNDLISGGILQALHICPLRPDAFIEYMKQEGKLGGQNKVPRLSNDRHIADALLAWKLP